MSLHLMLKPKDGRHSRKSTHRGRFLVGAGVGDSDYEGAIAPSRGPWKATRGTVVAEGIFASRLLDSTRHGRLLRWNDTTKSRRLGRTYWILALCVLMVSPSITRAAWVTIRRCRLASNNEAEVWLSRVKDYRLLEEAAGGVTVFSTPPLSTLYRGELP